MIKTMRNISLNITWTLYFHVKHSENYSNNMFNVLRKVELKDPSIAVLITNSNVKHQLTGSEYPSR